MSGKGEGTQNQQKGQVVLWSNNSGRGGRIVKRQLWMLYFSSPSSILYMFPANSRKHAVPNLLWHKAASCSTIQFLRLQCTWFLGIVFTVGGCLCRDGVEHYERRRCDHSLQSSRLDLRKGRGSTRDPGGVDRQKYCCVLPMRWRVNCMP